MSTVVSSSSTRAKKLNARYRKPKSLHHPEPIPEIDPSPIIISPSRSKPTISSILLAPFSPAVPNPDPPAASAPKKKNFTNLRRLGCAAASSQVSVPAVIRSSADWDSKRVKKKRQKCKIYSVSSTGGGKAAIPGNPPAAVGFVTSRRPALGRRKVDDDFTRPREGYACALRSMVTPEEDQCVDPDTSFEPPRSTVGIFGSRHHRHSRYGFTQELSEVVMLQSHILGGGLDGHDRYQDWRLDVDDMSYEDLLELGDRIGYVSTGLREDDIDLHVRRMKHELPTHFSTETERKCSICQEEYKGNDEIGKLECGHLYHIQCIKQWLQRKNACPVCKSAANSTGKV